MFQEIVKDTEIRANVWKDVRLNLTPHILAGLSALFYFAREIQFSETYKRIFEMEFQEAQSAFADSENSVREKYFHIFDKTNALYNSKRPTIPY